VTPITLSRHFIAINLNQISNQQSIIMYFQVVIYSLRLIYSQGLAVENKMLRLREMSNDAYFVTKYCSKKCYND
jgi:hypothetical protein